MNFKEFSRELQRHGYMYESELHMTGREIKSLYQFLVKRKIIKPLPNMVAVYEAFKANFTLQFSSASSLQRIKDDDAEIDAWRNVFLVTKFR